MRETRRRDRLTRLLTWTLAVALIASVAVAGYLLANPQPTTEPYTEFFVLGENRTASGYPTNVTTGTQESVIVGLTNHEHANVTYTVVVRVENRTESSRTIEVADRETWDRSMTFSAGTPGRKRLEILLYKDPVPDVSTTPYRYLRFWINVSAADSGPPIADDRIHRHSLIHRNGTETE